MNYMLGCLINKLINHTMSQVTVGVGYPIIRKTCLTWNHIYTYSHSTDYRQHYPKDDMKKAMNL